MNRGQEDDRIRNVGAELARASRLTEQSLAWSIPPLQTYALLLEITRITEAAMLSLNTVMESIKKRRINEGTSRK